MPKVLEIRSYTLKPNTRTDFHRLFVEHSLPMLKRWNVDVVSFGPSQHDDDSYYLMRAYDSLKHRQESQDAFYGSEEWIKGPREAIIAPIETYTSVVIEADESLVASLRLLSGK